jgi:hypothetical protein
MRLSGPWHIKGLPAAVPVSTGCSVTLSATPFGLQLVDNVLQVLYRTGEAVGLGDHERIAPMREVEQEPQLAPPLA